MQLQQLRIRNCYFINTEYSPSDMAENQSPQSEIKDDPIDHERCAGSVHPPMAISPYGAYAAYDDNGPLF